MLKPVYTVFCLPARCQINIVSIHESSTLCHVTRKCTAR